MVAEKITVVDEGVACVRAAAEFLCWDGPTCESDYEDGATEFPEDHYWHDVTGGRVPWPRLTWAFFGALLEAIIASNDFDVSVDYEGYSEPYYQASVSLVWPRGRHEAAGDVRLALVACVNAYLDSKRGG